MRYFKMTECNWAKTPLASGTDLSKNESEESKEAMLQRQFMGSRSHRSNSVQPDISFVVEYISRFMQRPTKALWTAAKRVSHYLNGAKEMGLVFGKEEGQLEMETFGDADMVKTDPVLKSISRFEDKCGRTLVTSRSKTTNERSIKVVRGRV